MNTYKIEKIGDRTTPEFEEEAIIFILMDALLQECENCSDEKDTSKGVTVYIEEELEEWN